MLSRRTRLWIMISITGSYFLAELIVGNVTNSLALVADSFHMLSDLISMVIGLVSIQLAERPKTNRLTFGWRRAETVGGLINGISLLALSFGIIVDSVERFFEPKELENPMLLLIVASVGLGLNLFAMILFAGSGGHGHSHGGSNVAESDHSISGSSHSHSHNGKESSSHGHSHASPTPHSHSSPSPLPTSARDDQTSPPPTLRQESSSAAILEASAPKRKSNLAMYSVFLHVLGDALGSIAVIASALFIWLTDFSWRFYVDPVISILLSVILIVGSSNLVRKTVLVLMQSTPLSVDTPKIAESISKIKGVLDIHDLHVWQLDETRTVASVHVVCRARSKWKRIAGEIQTIFHAVDVHAVTIQPEFEDLAIEDERSMSFTSLEGEDLSDKVVIKSSGVVETNVVRCRNACLSGECSEQRCCD